MKLRVVELLLVTTLPALFLATYASNHAHKYPSLKITIATLVGGTLAAGAANAFNMVMYRRTKTSLLEKPLQYLLRLYFPLASSRTEMPSEN